MYVFIFAGPLGLATPKPHVLQQLKRNSPLFRYRLLFCFSTEFNRFGLPKGLKNLSLSTYIQKKCDPGRLLRVGVGVPEPTFTEHFLFVFVDRLWAHFFNRTK